MPKPAKTRSDVPSSYLDTLHSFKEEVRTHYPIDRAIEDLAGVRFVHRSGSATRTACCPFHQEKTPSFSVNPQAGYYFCFGSGCGAKGDLFQFIMDYENVSFMEALQIAGRNAGLPFPTPNGKPLQISAGTSGSRKTSAPAQDLRRHPRDMPSHGLIPVPDGLRVPRAGAWASAWHEGNNTTPPKIRRYKPVMVHEYRNSDGQLLMSVLRMEMHNKTRDNGKPAKFFMPFRLANLPEQADDAVLVNHTTRIGWLIKGVPSGHLRPVYGMERVPQWRAAGGRKILIVEGEKTADAARRLLAASSERQDWIVFSPLGGGNSALHADWSDLAGPLSDVTGEIEVLVWPDADPPTVMRKTGRKIDRQETYASDIVNGLSYALHRAGVPLDQVSFARISPVDGVASGWDLADAEQDGWSGSDLLDWISEDRLAVVVDADFVRSEHVARGEADTPSPFEHDDFSVDVAAYETLIAEIGQPQDKNAMPQHKSDSQTDLDGLPAVKSGSPAENEKVLETTSDEGIPIRDLSHHEVLPSDTNGDDLVFNAPVVRLLENRHFRCLGFLNGNSYFLSLESNQVFELSPAKMKQTYLLHLAPATFWLSSFPAPAERNGTIKTDWEKAVDVLIRATNRTGQYDPCAEVGQGTWLDNGRIVFNSGRDLWVEGEGVVKLHEFSGEKTYVVGKPCGMPDFENPFPADAPEIWELLDIIQAIHWAPEGRKVSVMNMFGWLAIGPICGVLPWRPHLYLSGERGVGKSWIINNIINRIFKDYGENVKADSTESGLRNLLNGRAFPLIFDEAEGETPEDRQRMAKIIRLARHSATPGNSYVAQGVSGGGGQRQYAIASTFLMCSITPQLTASADFTRFGRAHLMGGLSHYDFVERIKGPAARLLDKTFSGRFMARMIMRAKDMDAVSTRMQEGLSTYHIEQRLIDVYGTYLAGAWLLLRDDIPESGVAAMSWVRKTFDMLDDLMSQIRDVSEDKDHVRLFRSLLSSNRKVESLSMGTRSYTVGELIQMLLGHYAYEDVLPASEAVRALSRAGIRLGKGAETAKKPEEADSLLIHKKSPDIEEILEKTPYAKSYVDVMLQAKGVRKGDKVVNFSGSSSRVVVVPLACLPLGRDVSHVRTEPARHK